MGRNSGKSQLEPDGFSIHTFELTKKLSRKEYRKLVDEAYCHCPPGQIYRDKTWQGAGERHRCMWFRQDGLRISFEQDVHNQIVSCRLRITVNPRKLMDPNSSYLGILPPTEESVQEVSKRFFTVLKDSGLPCVLDAYQLSRVDLCVNVRCDSTALLKELLRVTRKLPTPPKYERAVFRSENKKLANKYNKHHIALKHNSRELVLYDRTYQILENRLLLDEEKLPKGVLRFEVHELRERVFTIIKGLCQLHRRRDSSLLWPLPPRTGAPTPPVSPTTMPDIWQFTSAHIRRISCTSRSRRIPAVSWGIPA